PSRGPFKTEWCISQSLGTLPACTPLRKPRRRFPPGPGRSRGVVVRARESTGQKWRRGTSRQKRRRPDAAARNQPAEATAARRGGPSRQKRRRRWPEVTAAARSGGSQKRRHRTSGQKRRRAQMARSQRASEKQWWLPCDGGAGGRFPRFLHVAADGRIFRSVMAGTYSVVYLYSNFFIPAAVCGQVGWFCTLATVTSASVPMEGR
ncbi:uncharacterized protein LOC116547478, partial [Sapajus apella]|uniref:Uncharacterized protein LOC116547478 n=1 Tax=Sapajus apella TaxID=9515 RepID=A0A6J3HGW1_SAPAP